VLSALFDRASELRELTDGLQGVVQGTGRTVLVEGEPGIGKSRLLTEVIRDARDLGLSTFTAAAEELERRRPFGVVSDCLGLHGSADPQREEAKTGG
jgi:predicted ATPase